jgi:hypothetical protein
MTATNSCWLPGPAGAAAEPFVLCCGAAPGWPLPRPVSRTLLEHDAAPCSRRCRSDSFALHPQRCPRRK